MRSAFEKSEQTTNSVLIQIQILCNKSIKKTSKMFFIKTTYVISTYVDNSKITINCLTLK